MHAPHPSDSLSPEKMQLFMAGLAGMPPEEVRKAKVLYLRNAIAEYKAACDQVGHLSGFPMGCLTSMVPFKRNLQLQEEKIRNAMDVWKDDLKGETFDF